MFKKFCLGIFTIAVNIIAFGQGGFVENKGQVLDLDQNFRPEVQFYYQQSNTALYFQNNKVVYSFAQPDFIDESLYANNLAGLDSVKKTKGATFHRLDMEFLNANENLNIKRGEKSDGLTHFYLNKRNGIRDVGTFGSIIYENIYDNIDVIFYQQKTGIKYDIVLREGANLKDVQIKYLGAEKMSIENQKLIIKTNFKTLEEDIPFSFINGDKKSEIDVHYQLSEDGVLSFDTKEKGYSTLTIDPVLEWATYLNGSAVTTDALDYSTSHLDAAGNYYIYGMCYSAANNYPVTNPGVPAYAVSYNASADLFIAKFDPNRTLVWSTYLGGAGFEENYGSNNITTSGNTLHIVAERLSQSAPFVNGGGFFVAPPNDNMSGWARFNLTTGQLLHLTGLGGLRSPSIDVSSSGLVAIIGHAYNFDNPYVVARAGAFNQATNGGSTDMFFMLFNAAYTQIWGTYLGGPSPQEYFMSQFDNSNNIFFIGETNWFGSSTIANERIINRAGAYNQSTPGGGTDVMLGMFNTSGALTWNTMYGGNNSDARRGQQGGYAKLLIDPTTQQLLMFWNTMSTNLPLLNSGGGAYYKTVPTHPSFNGGGSFWNYAAYFARFTSGGALNHSSYWYSSTDGDLIHNVAFGGCNKLYIAGRTDLATATVIPVAGGFNLTTTTGQVILMQMDRTSLNAEWSSSLSNNPAYGPTCAGRADNPRIYVSSKGYNDAGPTADPGGGAYYQANNVNGASGPNYMIWQLHPTIPPVISGLTTICQGQTTTLTASGGAGAPYEWYTASSGGTAFFTGAVYTTPALSSNVTYYVSSGTGLCISSRTPVTINATATVPVQPSVISGTSSLCAASSQTYSVTNDAGVTYSWSYSGSGSPSSTTNSVTFTPTSSGTLSVTATNLCGTSSASTFAISVAAAVPAQPSAITGSSAVCTGSSQTYSVTNVAGVIYSWSYSGTGTATSSTNSVTFTPTTGGTLSVTATNACGTSSASTTVISVALAAPSQPSAISGTSAVCASSSQTYSVTNVAGVTYAWSYSGSGTATSSTNSVTFNPTTGGTLSVTATNACGISSSSTVAIAVAAAVPSQPSAISGTSSVCTASSQTYSVTNVAGVTYSWSYSGTGTATSSTNSVTFTPTTGGTLSVTATNACGTSSASSVVISVAAAAPSQPSAISGTSAVCASSSQTYSVTNVAGVTYSWSYSGGGTATSTTNSVTFNPTSGGTLSVTATNACGTSSSSTFAIAVSPAIPAQPSAISGTSSVCTASSQTYSVTNVAGVTYSWSYSGTGTATSSTNSVTFTPTTGGTLSVTATNVCGTSSSSSVAISVAAAAPSQPSAISGTSSVCTASSQTYSVTNVVGVSYAWSYSGGGTATSTTNSVTFNPTSGGTLSVTATNACGTSSSSTLALNVVATAPAQPSVISGSSTVCTATTQTYSVTNVAGVTYSWSYSGGGTATSTTNSVTFNPTTSGTLSVTATNACGTSSSSTFAIAVGSAPPVQPSVITGASATCTASSQTYSVTNVAGLTYAWSYSGSGTATSSTNSVTFNPTTSGTLSVTATNACGTSTASTLVITVDVVAPLQPSVINGTGTVCNASSQTYNVTNVAGVTYAWSYSGSGTASSSTNSVTFNPTTSGTLTVTANNACGASASSTFAITVDAATPVQPSVITGTSNVCTSTSQTYSVTNVAGVSYTWSYSGGGTATSSTNSVTFNPTSSGTLSVTATNTCGTSSSSTLAIVVDAVTPLQPSVISGSSAACTASSQTYSVTNVAGVSYSWSYSGGGTATSSTNAVTFNPTSSGTLSVTATNACGTSTSSAYAITVDAAIPVQPSAITGTNAVCTATSQTYSVTNVAGVTYSWSYSGGGTATSTTNSVTFNPTTSGTLSVTATNACGSSASSTYAITVDAAIPMQPAVIAGTSAVCEASSQTYSVTNVAGVSYTWSYTGGGAVASTTNSVSFNPTSSGTLSVTATNACGTSTSSTLALTVTPTPSSGTLSGTQNVCVGLTTAFSSTQSGGIWSTAVAGIATVDASTGLVTGAGVGTTTITYTVAGAGGCPDASATRTVTVTAAPVSGTLSADQDLCVGSTLTVTSSQAGGSWSTSSAGIATINASTGLVTGVSAGSATMTYTVAGTGGCPDATASLLISVPLQLNSQDTLDYMICFGDSVLINSTYYSTPGLYTNTVTSSSGCDSIIYYLVYQDASAPQIVTCFQDTTIDVNDMCTSVVPDFTTSTSLLITDNCGSVSTGEIVVSQSPVAGTVISNDAAVVITVTDASGNSSSCSFSIVLKGCEINVLESLSPNNDGKNDYFVIENIDKFPGTSLRVFNRWGTEVYFSDDYKNTWNGTSQSKYNVGGDQLPEGTYYYLLELGGLETNSNYGELYKGYLYIKR